MRYAFSAFLYRKLTSICAALLLLTALSMNGDTSLARTKLANGSTKNLSIAQDRKPVPQTELITITSTGFDPTELTLPAGEFLLDVDNRSEIEEVEWRLDRETGGRVARRARPSSWSLHFKRSESSDVDLPHHDYV